MRLAGAVGGVVSKLVLVHPDGVDQGETDELGEVIFGFWMVAMGTSMDC